MVGENLTNIRGVGSPQNQAKENWPEQQVRLSDTDRLEAFSDGVFSITITLLVFEIVRPEHEPVRLFDKLLAQWPTYVAFLASFLYVGVIWLNHHSIFARVRYCDRRLHWANLLGLLTTGLIPFPTAVLSAALMHGSQFDAKVAVALYAGLGALMCCTWLYSFHLLGARTVACARRDCGLFPRWADRLGPLAETGAHDLSRPADLFRGDRQRVARDKHPVAPDHQEMSHGTLESRPTS